MEHLTLIDDVVDSNNLKWIDLRRTGHWNLTIEITCWRGLVANISQKLRHNTRRTPSVDFPNFTKWPSNNSFIVIRSPRLVLMHIFLVVFTVMGYWVWFIHLLWVTDKQVATQVLYFPPIHQNQTKHLIFQMGDFLLCFTMIIIMLLSPVLVLY